MSSSHDRFHSSVISGLRTLRWVQSLRAKLFRALRTVLSNIANGRGQRARMMGVACLTTTRRPPAPLMTAVSHCICVTAARFSAVAIGCRVDEFTGFIEGESLSRPLHFKLVFLGFYNSERRYAEYNERYFSNL